MPLRSAPRAHSAKRWSPPPTTPWCGRRDRKSTRLNSSHQIISYAVFCLKKKTQQQHRVSPEEMDVGPAGKTGPEFLRNQYGQRPVEAPQDADLDCEHVPGEQGDHTPDKD